MDWVFRAGQDGYARYRVPAIVTVGSRILAFAEGRRGFNGDWGAIDVVLRIKDHGDFGDLRVVSVGGEGVEPNPAAMERGLSPAGETTYHNPVPVVDGDAVHLLYAVHYRRLLYRRSDDAGDTWGAPVDITGVLSAFNGWRVCACGPGHGLRMESGRLVVPVWLSSGTEGPHAHHPSILTAIYSDDSGESWKAGGVVSSEHNPSEATAIDSGYGCVMLNVRTESPTQRRMIAASSDPDLQSWARAYVDSLPEVVCQGSWLALSATRTAYSGLARANPRGDLSLWIGDRPGWSEPRLIHEGSARYSDLATGPDGELLVLYEAGSQSKGGIALRWVEP